MLGSTMSPEQLNMPLQYKEGRAHFFGLDFVCDQRALIPRFETEFLVQKTIEWCSAHPDRQRVVDIGTGSGIIAASLAVNVPNVDITAIDLSSLALSLAQENAVKHRIENRIKFMRGNLLESFTGPVDVILANLPYIPAARIVHLDSSVRDFEPHVALNGGEDGLELYRQLLDQIAKLSKRPSLCVFEFDEGQEDLARKEIASRLPNMKVEILKDLSGLTRYIVLTS